MEDTPFNQRYILRLLERWSHQTTLVENGRQALEAFKRETFDIVLMDVQMPEMDGLQATRKIREWESVSANADTDVWETEIKGQRTEIRRQKTEEGTQASNFQHPTSNIPIVAMTAHVIKGDRERCLEAGMNEYESKPIDSDKLFETIEKLTRGSGIKKPAPAEPFIADSSSLLKVFDEDWDFLKEVVEVFIEDYPRLFDNLQQSFEEGDCDTFMRSAHSLKGMLKNFKAETAAEIAFDLEKKGKAADLQGVQAVIDRLAAHISEVYKILRNMIKEQYG
jgi:CheY-like chemotaxis protein